MSELNKLTLLEAREGLLDKKFSAMELTMDCMAAIDAGDHINAFITETPELALERARKSDEKIAKNDAGKLEGIPIAVKDVFCTKGVRTTCASRILENFVPPYESTVTKKLLNEGYVMVGKVNLDEFACGSTTKTSHFGPTFHPMKSKKDDRDLIPGGSSGGSAAALAANMCIASTGTDTGGSIRQPAALCGLVGIKPTYGRVSRYGIASYASSLDQAGVFTKNVRDCAYLTEIICGLDSKDPTSSDRPVPNFLREINPNMKGKKIGLVKEFLSRADVMHADIRKSFSKTVEDLKKAGAEFVEVSIPSSLLASALYTIISYTELASNLSKFDGVRFGYRTAEKVNSLDEMYMKTRAEGFGENVKKRVLIGYHCSSHENYEAIFVKAQKIRRKLSNEITEAFRNVDVIMTPATPSAALPIDMTEAELKLDKKSNYLNDVFICPVNMAGLPGMSVPVGISSYGLPMGVHLIGRHFDEQSIFNTALAIEEIQK